MKKIILIFALSLSIIPNKICAQSQNYKPAISFDYNYFLLGKIDEKQFITNLEDDLLTPEIYDSPRDLRSIHENDFYNLWDYSEKLNQVYKEFVYYTDFPEQSPIWNRMNAEEILEKNEILYDEINRIFKKDTRYGISKQIKKMNKELRIMEQNTRPYRNGEIEISFPESEKEITNYEYYSPLIVYYALRFIKEELLDKDDFLRYDRAIIDLTLIYGNQEIQITDKRPAAQFLTNKRILFNRAKVNYLVQLININRQIEKANKYREMQEDVMRRVESRESHEYNSDRFTINGRTYTIVGDK